MCAVYPERMIIYHGGTLSKSDRHITTIPPYSMPDTLTNSFLKGTTFLACLKLSTFFVFGFFDLLMVPSYLAANQPWQQTLFSTAPSLFPPSLSHPSHPT